MELNKDEGHDNIKNVQQRATKNISEEYGQSGETTATNSVLKKIT